MFGHANSLLLNNKIPVIILRGVHSSEVLLIFSRGPRLSVVSTNTWRTTQFGYHCFTISCLISLLNNKVTMTCSFLVFQQLSFKNDDVPDSEQRAVLINTRWLYFHKHALGVWPSCEWFLCDWFKTLAGATAFTFLAIGTQYKTHTKNNRPSVSQRILKSQGSRGSR